MLELNLAQTGCLALALLLSLVLPLMMGARSIQNVAVRKVCLKIVCAGQLSLGASCLLILRWPATFLYIGAFVIMSSFYFGYLLRKKLRTKN